MAFKDPCTSMSPFAYERRMYEATRNPIHVWMAFHMCSGMMRAGVYRSDSLPEWVLDYFDGIFNTICDLFDSNTTDSPTRAKIAGDLAQAFGLLPVGQGVRSSAFSDYKLQKRDMYLAVEVLKARRLNPDFSWEAAIAHVSELKGVGIDIVERAWKSWRNNFPIEF